MSIQPTLNTSSVASSLVPGTLNTSTVISLLMQVAQQPIANLQNQITTQQNNDSTYQTINTSLSSLTTAVNALTDPTAFRASLATSSNTSALTATSDTTASPGTYTITTGAPATATMATSTNGIGTAIDTTSWSNNLGSLNFGKAATDGTFSYSVDNQQFSYNLTDVNATSLQSVLTSLAGTMQTQIDSTDPGATVSATITNNKVQFNISGATSNHSLTFGSAGDSSNFLSTVGLNAVSTTTFGGGGSGATAVNGTTNLGVSTPTNTLDQAGISSLQLTNGGQFTINGVQIQYDTGSDTLDTIIGKINSSAAGVTAAYNPTTDKLVLTNKSTGSTAITMSDDSGNLLSSLNLAPGTNTAQTLGQNTSVTVNGTTTISASNSITTAIPGVTLNVLQASSSPITLTVGTNTSSISTLVTNFVNAVNNSIDAIGVTQQKDSVSGKYGPLFGDPILIGIQNNLYNMTSQLLSGTNPAGGPQSLQDIGITTGVPGATPGSTTHLQIDTTKLTAALQSNPQAVANLFQATSVANGVDGVGTQFNKYLTPLQGPDGPFITLDQQTQTSVASLNSQIANMQLNLQLYQQELVAKFSAMNNALAQATQASQQLTSALGSTSLLGSTAVSSSTSSSPTGF